HVVVLLPRAVQPIFSRPSSPSASQPIPAARGIGPFRSAEFQRRDLFRLIIPSRDKILAAVHAPVIRILQNPRFPAAFAGIKQARPLVNLEKYILHEVFGFSGVSEDSPSDA